MVKDHFIVKIYKTEFSNYTIYTIYSQCAKWHHNCPEKSYKMGFSESNYTVEER